MSASGQNSTGLPRPANDNRRKAKALRVIVNLPPAMPVQQVEVEVFAALLETLTAANDNEEP